ncbi:hypothetical protein CDO87_03560 [Sagittula sp. P11]|uniref:helix-turn-helix transcriptional regulator n=1 Tax=Sagittula sp. P11 TaxID=2009329 RepID=UPI000C2D5D8D|nr:hypothetical protein [Sagittula sp. P11]AUC52321.1 hypothetical protein CDO87_03560 [Sagittula sp. P11]
MQSTDERQSIIDSFPDFITASQVAAMTGFSNATAFLKARDRLERDEEFPAPMPTQLRPMKWRRDAVAAWVDGLAASDPIPPAHGGNVVAFPARM